jgi:hypothetical protein
MIPKDTISGSEEGYFRWLSFSVPTTCMFQRSEKRTASIFRVNELDAEVIEKENVITKRQNPSNDKIHSIYDVHVSTNLGHLQVHNSYFLKHTDKMPHVGTFQRICPITPIISTKSMALVIEVSSSYFQVSIQFIISQCLN